jgi:hypothetical protein
LWPVLLTLLLSPPIHPDSFAWSGGPGARLLGSGRGGVLLRPSLVVVPSRNATEMTAATSTRTGRAPFLNCTPARRRHGRVHDPLAFESIGSSCGACCPPRPFLFWLGAFSWNSGRAGAAGEGWCQSGRRRPSRRVACRLLIAGPYGHSRALVCAPLGGLEALWWLGFGRGVVLPSLGGQAGVVVGLARCGPRCQMARTPRSTQPAIKHNIHIYDRINTLINRPFHPPHRLDRRRQRCRLRSRHGGAPQHDGALPPAAIAAGPSVAVAAAAAAAAAATAARAP